MSGYTKLFNSILMSSIWEESVETRIVWVSLLALADKNGHVDATMKSLARVARVSLDACERAITCLLSPDPNDRSGVMEGRRIQPEPGGWLIVNHGYYRHRMSEDERRERDRLRKREARASAKRPQTSENVRDVSHTEAEADPKANTETKAVPKLSLVDGSDLWLKVIEQAKTNGLSEKTIREWFRPCSAIQRGSGQVEVTAPTTIIADWLTSQYKQTISDAWPGLRWTVRVQPPLAARR